MCDTERPLFRDVAVRAIDPVTGDVYKEFDSVTSAQTFFVGRYTANISNVLNGRNMTAYGYRWEYA